MYLQLLRVGFYERITFNRAKLISLFARRPGRLFDDTEARRMGTRRLISQLNRALLREGVNFRGRTELRDARRRRRKQGVRIKTLCKLLTRWQ